MSRPAVVVLDHGMGNLRSVAKALEAAGARVTVTADEPAIVSAAGLCVPGQGIFGRCMSNLAASGLDAMVRSWVQDARPYLGICLGMQVLFESSEERGPVAGLGVLAGAVRRLTGAPRLPHIGWNEVAGEHYYFDHSFVVDPADPALVTGWCEHGERFAARVETDGITGVQFHPEKSGRAGIALLEKWVVGL